jgi:hypothetical protein
VIDKLFAPAGSQEKLVFAWTDPHDPWSPLDESRYKTAVAQADLGAVSMSEQMPLTTAKLLEHFADDAIIDANDWDQAAQLYLALSAVADRVAAKLPPNERELLQTNLDAFRTTVQFPVQTEGSGDIHYFDSPRHYSAEKFNEAKKSLIEALSPDN